MKTKSKEGKEKQEVKVEESFESSEELSADDSSLQEDKDQEIALEEEETDTEGDDSEEDNRIHPEKEEEKDKANLNPKRVAILLKRLRNAVHRQAKTAKKYELRKVIREIKNARTKEDKKLVVKNEKKLESLKLVDIDKLTSFALANANDEQTEVVMFNDENLKRIYQKLSEFKGLKAAVIEFYDRPKREAERIQRKKRKQEEIQRKLAKKEARASNPIACNIGNCQAKFATEEARQIHCAKRHKTTGNREVDKTLGLKVSSNRPGQRERRKLAAVNNGTGISALDIKHQEIPQKILVTSKREDSKPNHESLHPSWEAKKKLLQMATQTNKFKGSVVEFDDDN